MKGLHFHPSPSLPSAFETESTQMRGAFESINAILISTIHATKQLMSLGPLSMNKCMGMEARNFSSIRSAFTYVYLVSVPIFGLFRCGFFFLSSMLRICFCFIYYRIDGKLVGSYFWGETFRIKFIVKMAMPKDANRLLQMVHKSTSTTAENGLFAK